MGKKRKSYLSPEFYARHEETQRILRERLEYHRQRRERLAREQQDEKPS
jgi:hypothetical protein